MNPQLERPAPPYAQIADHYRQRIHDGTLAEGARLPSVLDVAREFSVSAATAAKAVAQLQVEGLVWSSPRGSWVAGKDSKATSPETRVLRSREPGRTTAGTGETYEVTAVELVTAPAYVSELLGLDDPPEVIRREWITSESKVPRALTVTWYPAELSRHVVPLLSRQPEDVGPMLAHIEATTGPVARGRDYVHARVADHREASALRVPVGTAILAGTWLLWNADGSLIEYGEYVIPPRHTLSYPYEVPAPGTESAE
jgi:GntR family transcriptional regulator